MKDFDVIVIGGGHAGCEAAHAAARMGCQTALLTLDPKKIGMMSCNPAMGGLAKGQLIKEIDALGGIMGRMTDRAAIQYRRLNESKGPAVRSSRAQCDKALYALNMQEFLGNLPGLTLLPFEVNEVLIEDQKVAGVRIADGSVIRAKTVVICSGTFLKSLMFTGFEKTEGGRVGDRSSVGLSSHLASLGFRLSRLKTGTPPRLHRASIQYDQLEAQSGDTHPLPFSFYHRPSPFPFLPQIHCFITYTNAQTHELIEESFHRSPLFSGHIQGIGPRYCPSIEDKVKRFRTRDRHQIFLEPEGLSTDEVYVNGISTSLPKDVQENFVRSIVGLKNAQFIRYGYAVEYDCIDARQLKVTLESKDYSGLFFAGQINGTSGYEEAGAQGLLAGINAALICQESDPFVLSRTEGYLGVLADDLVLKGTDEPYRMFTSRAEYRLLLREDNADLRLSERGWKLGLLGDSERHQLEERRHAIQSSMKDLEEFYLLPNDSVNQWCVARNMNPLKDRVSGEMFLRRPEIHWADLCDLGFLQGVGVALDIQEQVEIQVKYAGYIQRDIDTLEGVKRSEAWVIPSSLDFDQIPGLSNEVKARFKLVRPETIGQASRMMGVTPAAVANLMIYLRMQDSQKAPALEIG